MVKKSYILFVSLLVLTGCSLFSKPSDPVEVLPPVTQEGKNTFGCLVNGEIWIPKGYNGLTNPDASYDPGVAGGSLGVDAYRADASSLNDIFVYVTGLSSAGTFDLSDPVVGSVLFYKTNHCYYDKDGSISRVGSLIITKLDLQAHIVAGKFEIILIKANCDTIRISDGRFDMKF